MKTFKVHAFLILLASLLLFSSCRTEDEEIINPENEQNLVANSSLANLLTRTSLNDGSVDNILDNANCFTVVLPVTVFIEDLEIFVDSEADFQTLEEIFDDFGGDVTTLDFAYPITIILEDYTEVIINNTEELAQQAANCNGENEEDDDIECIDFQYPLSYSVFNSVTEVLETVVVNNDAEHYAFLESIEDNDLVSINFPFTLILADGSTLVVNSIDDLEDAIEAAIDACDEDDDNDYEDDDCENCSTDDLLDALTSCDAFEVDKLKRNGNDLSDNYENFDFQFFEDGSIDVNDGTTSYAGNWAAQGEGQNIIVTINVPDLPVFNDDWNLQEISTDDDGEIEIDLRKGDDRLGFECDDDDSDDDDGDDDVENCDDCTTDSLLQALLDCESGFEIDQLERDDQDLEDQYEDVSFVFNEDGSVLVESSSSSTTGTWSSSGDGNTILFQLDVAIDDIDDEWTVHSIEIEDNEISIDLRKTNGDRLKLTCN